MLIYETFVELDQSTSLGDAREVVERLRDYANPRMLRVRDGVPVGVELELEVGDGEVADLWDLCERVRLIRDEVEGHTGLSIVIPRPTLKGPARAACAASYRGVTVSATLEESVEGSPREVTVRVYVDPSPPGLDRLAYQRGQRAPEDAP